MNIKNGKLLIGYDVEAGSDGLAAGLSKPDTTKRFLESMLEIHNQTQTSPTIFVTGQTLEQNVKEFQEVAKCSLIDIQQHTYSHQCLKPLIFFDSGIPEIGTPGLTLDKLRKEIAKTNQLIKDIIDRDCIGITGPAGYFLGLCDRPDILEILKELGIGFTRTWGRSANGLFNFTEKGEKDWREPFWLKSSGFPEILEFPFQGNDYNIRKEIGWDNKEAYRSWFKSMIDIAAAENKTWSYAIHDHSGIFDDPQMLLVKELIDYALHKGLKITNYLTEYQRMKKRNA